MAEILLKAQDETPPNPASQRGDLVAVMNDGHLWGQMEGLPDFYVIKVTDRTVDDVLPYAAFMVDETTGEETSVRRFYGHNSPPEWQAELGVNGFLVKTWAELLPYIVDKTTGTPITGSV